MATRKPPLPKIGWPLLPLPDENGYLVFPTLEESVRQSIEIILRTRPGEQRMHPDFGAGLAEVLGEPNTVSTKRRIRDFVTESLGRWETRIFLDRVEVFDEPGSPTHVRLEIGYRLRRTGAPASMNLTMQLEG